MPRVGILPYFTADRSSWYPSDWSVSIDGRDAIAAGGILPGWDYQATLAIHEEHTIVDTDKLRTSSRLSREASLLYAVTIDCEAAGLRNVVYREELPESGQARLTAAFSLPPRTYAGAISITRQVVLWGPDGSPPPTASFRGAVLLAEQRSERTEIILEGDAGRFPTEAVDFRSTGRPDAVWALSITYVDPTEPFTSAVRLSLNTDRSAVKRLIEDPDASESRVLMNVLSWDLQRQLLLDAAANAELFDLQDWPEGSLGEAVMVIIRDRMGLTNIRQLQAMLSDDDLTYFETELQARTGLFRD